MINAPDPMERIRREHRLCAILRGIAVGRGSTSNAEVMSEWLNCIGLGCARRILDGELGELACWGLITLERHGELVVIGITRDGREVADGTVTRDGVARPGPDCPY